MQLKEARSQLLIEVRKSSRRSLQITQAGVAKQTGAAHFDAFLQSLSEYKLNDGES